MQLKKGDKAPDFTGIDQDGKVISLKDFAGRKLVLYFYPQDGTPTCTTQACNLRDNFSALKAKGIEVVGVSTDSEKKHKNFIEKQHLPFRLIADTERVLHELYGTWGEKSMYGKTYFGTLRTTFLIDENGIIIDVIEKVKAKEHAEQIFALI